MRYNRGKEYLASKGIRVIDGQLFGKQDYYRSGSIKERADEFNQLLYNDDVQVLMAAIGGYNSNSILPYIDYEYNMPAVWTDEFISWSEQDRAKEEYANSWVSVIPGTCRGRLVGGNLNTMHGFFGTEYMPEIKQGDILFIEDSLKDACTIERSFSMLKLAGVFDKISEIVDVRVSVMKRIDSNWFWIHHIDEKEKSSKLLDPSRKTELKEI